MKTLLTSTCIAATVLFGSSLVTIVPGIDGSTVVAAEKSSEKKRRRTPAMGSRVYSQLARAQELADAGNVAEGLAVLDSVKDKADSLNSYERAMMHNFYGFIYYNAERMTDAMNAFEQVVAQSPIPESLEKSTLFSLSQLAMANGDYQKTLDFLTRWESVNEGDIPVKNYVLKAQATYQAKRYEEAASYIDTAIKLAEKQEAQPLENWYVLQRAVYFELKQPKKVTKVLETMVRKFNKPEYWVQLGGMYGEIGEEEKQLAVLEAAYLQGYITKKTQLRNLAQIYYFNGLPYKAGSVMQKAIDSQQLASSEKNLKFMAQSWLAAKEYDLAVNAFDQLAKVTKGGDAYQQIAEIRLQQGKYQATITAGQKAAEQGDLTNPGNLYLAMGMAYFNLKEFEASIDALNQAKEHKSVQRMAKQWLKFVERERSTYGELAAL
ncbi:hypothetical protein J1N51_09800 [Psychrosphaera ytuae]|uniref:Tetratricopeptide repeat protein n=1 Tax=Psychrosphaera ytuae TaxID=2820710 RepID=A0A975DA44_9GAMM|nr:hypothetical protein [Psychrosphaera ytuae]QTH63038.1 hypothetical protein J1N51_09800 [Psychrosphaera ytuae]